MKIKKLYEFSHKRQLWRIIPSDSGKLVIEERDTLKKEAFFSCLGIESGKKIFENLQPDEKYWIGIEEVYRDIIFFHKYLKPDMPIHKGIIAFEINSRSIIWENTEYSFLFILEEKLYCCKTLFEGKKYFVLNLLTGEVINELEDNFSVINKLKESASGREKDDYLFPENFDENQISGPELQKKFREENLIPGKIKGAAFDDAVFLHALKNTNAGTRNIFKVMEIPTGKVILSEVLGGNNEKLLPEAFFIKGRLLFLLKEKDRLVVYSIK